MIATAEKSSATVSLTKLGRVELAPNSSLKLSFTETSIMGVLESGSARVSTLAGASVNFATKDGAVIVDGSQATSFTVSVAKGITSLKTHSGVAQLRSGGAVKQVAAGENATAGTPNPAQTPDNDDDDDLSGGELAVLLIAAGGALFLIWQAIHHDNDLNFGGAVTVVSPTK
jgi:ferric-dicitrate binding protein FerR (iron transport regulator)